MTTGSKKRGCAANIYLREVLIFPEYKVCDRLLIYFGVSVSNVYDINLRQVFCALP